MGNSNMRGHLGMRRRLGCQVLGRERSHLTVSRNWLLCELVTRVSLTWKAGADAGHRVADFVKCCYKDRALMERVSNTRAASTNRCAQTERSTKLTTKQPVAFKHSARLAHNFCCSSLKGSFSGLSEKQEMSKTGRMSSEV